MYVSLMTMEKDNFLKTMDTEKSYRRDFQQLLEKHKRLDTLHDVFQLRQDIIKAAKIVVGLDIMNQHIQPKALNVPEHVWGKKKVTEEYKQAKAEQYAFFARMPFSTIFIENWTGGHLVYRNPDGVTWTQTTVMHVYDPGSNSDYAMSMGQDLIVDPCRVDKDGFIWTESIPSATFAEMITRRGNPEITRTMTRVQASEVAETLLFLNVKNLEPQRYKISKADAKAMKAVPKVFQPYCDYRVLDIYRRNAPIKSLDDLTQRVMQQHKDINRAESRAHLVRGHFKNLNGSLFWWNPFMRNRKRLETHGFADKDYQLIT